MNNISKERIDKAISVNKNLENHMYNLEDACKRTQEAINSYYKTCMKWRDQND